jgi:aryl-alcohol dehydrogenase-like predicted oxidoreductase
MLARGVRDDDYQAGDIRLSMPRFLGDNLRHNLAVVAEFDALAADAGMTSAQLALGWVLARGDHIVAIPGTRSIVHLEEDVGAATISLPADLVKAVDDLFEGNIRGARYVAPMQAQIDTEILPGEELAG